MTSITQQKTDLKDILTRIVMSRYDSANDAGKRDLAWSLLRHYMNKMTLEELRSWHQGITIREYVIERELK